MPFAIAPTGFTRLMHTEGELAGARVAAAAGIPFSLSTLGTASIDDVATAAPQGRKWFQLYMWRDRGTARWPLAAAGRPRPVSTPLLATVDVPVAGARLRDVRNGMSIPPALTLPDSPSMRRQRPLLVVRPDDHRAPVVRVVGSLVGHRCAEYLDTMFDPSLTFDDLAWIKSQWPGKLVVKGIQTVEDARAVVDHGVDALVVSNHGGRQLDRAPVPLDQVARVVSQVGAPGPRCSSTAASCAAPTSSPRSLWVRVAPRRPGLPVRADGRRRGRRAAGCRHSAPASFPVPCNFSASPASRSSRRST